MTVTGSPSVFCKLLLPQCYKKKDDKPSRSNHHHRNQNQNDPEKTSSVFKTLSRDQNNRQVSYTFKAEVSKIRVLNESINKYPLRPDPYKNYSLICEDIFMGTGWSYAKTTALLETDWKIILKMIVNRHV